MLFFAWWKGAFFQPAPHHALQRLVVDRDAQASREEVSNLGEPVDHELLDERVPHGDLVQFLDQLVVALAAAVLSQCRPDRAHVRSCARVLADRLATTWPRLRSYSSMTTCGTSSSSWHWCTNNRTAAIRRSPRMFLAVSSQTEVSTRRRSTISDVSQRTVPSVTRSAGWPRSRSVGGRSRPEGRSRRDPYAYVRNGASGRFDAPGDHRRGLSGLIRWTQAAG